MQSIVREQLAALTGLCRARRVRALFLFGSAAGAGLRVFDPARSDLDFLVEFEPMTPQDRAESFFAFEADLEELFLRPIGLTEIDGVRSDAIRRHIEQTKVPLYAAA